MSPALFARSQCVKLMPVKKPYLADVLSGKRAGNAGEVGARLTGS
jgi:hypothetical protein